MSGTFTERELKLIRKVQNQPPRTVVQISESCPSHSYCTPLPLFRVYKIDDTSFEAQWNGYHDAGPAQIFRFEDVNQPDCS
jgi:hypothetical protein